MSTALALAQAGYETINCSNCGIAYAIPLDWLNAKRRDHGTFYCPNGHSQYFAGKSEADKLRAELEQEQRRHQFTRNDRDAAQRDAATKEAQRRGEKAAKTRIKKRIAAGVCPCCNRTFAELAAHIATKHPEFVAESKA